MKNIREFIKGMAMGLFIIGLIATITFLVIVIVKHLREEHEKTDIEETTIYKVTDENISRHPYIVDSGFQGEFSDLTVFDYPFRRSDDYVKNKELLKESRDLCEELSKTAQEYIVNALTIDYRDLASNPQVYLKTLSELCVMDIPIMRDLTDDESEIISRAEILEENIDFYIKNRVNMEADFMTSPSLVWQDGYYYVRGIITLTVHTADDLRGFGEEIELGTPKNFMVELSFRQEDMAFGDNDNSNIYKMLFLQDTDAFFEYVKEDSIKSVEQEDIQDK